MSEQKNENISESEIQEKLIIDEKAMREDKAMKDERATKDENAMNRERAINEENVINEENAINEEIVINDEMIIKVQMTPEEEKAAKAKKAAKKAKKAAAKAIAEAGDKAAKEAEASYQKAITLMNCIGCMVTRSEKVEMYQQASKLFTQMSGYKDADQYARDCSDFANQIDSEVKKKVFKNALRKKENAKQAEEYKIAADEFRTVSTFKNSEELAEECDLLRKHIETKATRHRLFKFGLIAFCFVVLFVLANTSHAKYYSANLSRMVGSYQSAIQTYHKLGAYKDCPDRLVQTRYQYALSAEKDKDFITAKKEFIAAGDYKDSADKVVQMEQQIIRKCKRGDELIIGDAYWYLIETKDNKALLMKKAAIKGKAYNDLLSDVTWEKSSLRQWLNSEFIEDVFTTAERQQVMLSTITPQNNAVYGTLGGEATQDYVFLLSASDVELYKKQLTHLENNSWLCSPGSAQNTAAFLSVKGTVMNYGYEVTSDQIVVYPFIWFNLE